MPTRFLRIDCHVTNAPRGSAAVHEKTISGKLRAEYPLLERSEIVEDVIRAVREEFPWAAATESTRD
jgi:hypothetical protein